MNKKIITLVVILFSIFSLFPPCMAENMPRRPLSAKELKQLDNEISARLNLTDEQIKILRANRTKNLKSMEETIKKMEITRKKIHDVYILGIPKFQADIKTAPMKIELALLKQNADKIREENRKNFEKILTSEQKAEFEKFKIELQARRQAKNNN